MSNGKPVCEVIDRFGAIYKRRAKTDWTPSRGCPSARRIVRDLPPNRRSRDRPKPPRPGTWKGLVELPNTVSKVKSMKAHVEKPLIDRFQGNPQALHQAGLDIGGEDMRDAAPGADVAMLFHPLPRIPVMVTFWDEEPEEGYGAEAKLLFDETIVDHLDIESIMFLSERVKELLCDETD